MLCYRDRTYCPFYNSCAKGPTCNRALTEEIEYKAQAAGLRVCRFIDHPECFEYGEDAA
jgi:hypothetical protein